MNETSGLFDHTANVGFGILWRRMFKQKKMNYKDTTRFDLFDTKFPSRILATKPATSRIV